MPQVSLTGMSVLNSYLTGNETRKHFLILLAHQQQLTTWQTSIHNGLDLVAPKGNFGATSGALAHFQDNLFQITV